MTIIDLELKEELSSIKNFERLNDEKITPYFLKLAKTPETSESLTSIKDENNRPYLTNNAKRVYINFIAICIKSP